MISATMGYSWVLPGRLAQGSAPPVSGIRYPFDLIVLCAEEYQPHPIEGVRLLHCPLDDARPTEEEVIRAQRAASRVANEIRRGYKVLVTCRMGLNRSGLVTGLALVKLGNDPDRTIRAIRKARGHFALSNGYFERIVRAEGDTLERRAPQHA